MENPQISIFHTSSIEGGFAWSVTSLLGRILHRAEVLFGDRDKSYTILGVELVERGYPQIWFPGGHEGRKDIIIQLTSECYNDFNRAIFQLAHEVVHCLHPSQNGSTVLEEGLGNWFSAIMCREFGSTYNDSDSVEYHSAHMCVKQLMDKDQEIIKKARKCTAAISSITKEELLAICPTIEDSLLDILLTPFSEYKP